jgi:hypothetical protein
MVTLPYADAFLSRGPDAAFAGDLALFGRFVGTCMPRGQCGAMGPRVPRTWPLTCVVPTGFEPVSPP